MAVLLTFSCSKDGGDSSNNKLPEKDKSKISEACGVWHWNKQEQYERSPQDRIINNVPDEVSTQDGESNCITSTMSHVNKLLGGKNDQEYYDKTLAYLGFNLNNTNGLPADATQRAFESIFNSTSFNGYTNAIDNGHPVITNCDGHSVTVVGYTNDGRVIFMDPEQSSLQQAPESFFGSEFNITVTGNKF